MTRTRIDALVSHEIDPLCGGYTLFQHEDGSYEIEICQHAMDDPNDVLPWTPVEIYRIPVPLDVFAEFDWVRRQSPLNYLAEFISQGQSPDVKLRARTLYEVAITEGLEEFDHEPLTLSAEEVLLRYNRPGLLSEVVRHGVESSTGVEQAIRCVYEGLARAKEYGVPTRALLLAAIERMRKTLDFNGGEELSALVLLNEIDEGLKAKGSRFFVEEGTSIIVLSPNGNTMVSVVRVKDEWRVAEPAQGEPES